MGFKWVAVFAARGTHLRDQLQGAKFREPSEIFDKEKLLDLGGVRVKLLRLGPAHTRGDTAVFVEGDSVLFSGDLAMHKLFPAFATPQSRLGSWLTSLDALDALRAKQVIGAHYGMSDASMIGAYRDVLKGIGARTKELKAQGKSEADIGKELTDEFAKKYPDWIAPVRVPAAVSVYYKLP